MIATLKRREFLTLLGGAAAWPLAARAQQALPAIGFLHEGLPAPLSLTTAFQQGLIEAGVSAGSSLRIENRWAEGQYDRLPALAADLIEHRVGDHCRCLPRCRASSEGRNADGPHCIHNWQRSHRSGPRSEP
jgi:hypothetical protein